MIFFITTYFAPTKEAPIKIRAKDSKWEIDAKS